MKIHCPQKGKEVSHKYCENCNVKLSCDAKQISDSDRRNTRIILGIGIVIIILVTLNNYLEIL